MWWKNYLMKTNLWWKRKKKNENTLWWSKFGIQKSLWWKKFSDENVFVKNNKKLSKKIVVKKIWWKKILLKIFFLFELVCDENSITRIVTKLKNLIYYKNLKIKIWKIWKTQVVTILNNLNCDIAQIFTKLNLLHTSKA